MKTPIREKYINEIFKPLFIFGRSKDNLYVDVCNIDGDVISLPEELAEKLIEVNKEYMQKLRELIGFKIYSSE